MGAFVYPSSAGSAKMSEIVRKMSPNGRLLGSLGHPWGTLGLHWAALCAKSVSKYGLKLTFSRFLKMYVFLHVFDGF